MRWFTSPITVARSVLRSALAAAAVGTAAGCSSPNATLLSPTTPNKASLSQTPGSEASTPSALRLIALGRSMRVALNERAARQSVANAFDASPYVEWRVPLRRVMANTANNAGYEQLRSRLATVEQFENLVSIGRELELHMPFDDQRRAWNGDAAVDIAVRYPGSRNGVLIVADGTEQQIVHGQKFEPSRPMIVLAESEINFDDYDSAVRGGTYRQLPIHDSWHAALWWGEHRMHRR